ncbi:hypothetical protein GCM10007036_31960 [Alsobacter metallidurans]|uniref:Uncharacterized protein n=1 Tax=Alsobacter metallidurans TaxID=340221 RepID=A0A917I8M5_9HYPH|nr:hypothetical protein [Alsobacter metallidurans]GGH25089.1 hypothetical protein GCM10007036_31960 [Alsobacter metallidurans]
MTHQILALAMAALCGWAGRSMRQPGAGTASRVLGLLAFGAATALVDDALGGLLLGALTSGPVPAGAESTLEELLGKL